jgi:hypothetical protein
MIDCVVEFTVTVSGAHGDVSVVAAPITVPVVLMNPADHW